jgi:PAP2 superfamily
MDMSAGGASPALRNLPGAVGAFLRQVARALPAAVRRDSTLITIILVYWICGLFVAHIAGIPPGATITTYLGTYVPMTAFMIASLILGRGAVIMIHDRPARPLRQLLEEVRTTLATPQRLAHAIPMVAGMLLFGGTFTVIKTTIPYFAPFTWDATFEQWDRWLHGGFAPWQLLHPILGWPPVTRALDWLYDLWFYILSLLWVWQAFSQRDDRLRRQFFLTVLLGWILLGNVAAMLLSSAGPCFFGKITGLPDPYEPLMSYLFFDANDLHPIFAVGAQNILWHAYLQRALTVGAGISAMPSMHVALATLFALVCWRAWRWLGIVMTTYAIIVLIASVHLGWHYAVDGYFGAVGMIAIWWLVGHALARREEMRRRLTETGAA